MSTLFKLLFSLSLLFWAVGCEKDTSPTETNQTEKPRWQVNEYFLLDNKILLNSTVSSGKYYVAGLFQLAMFDDPGLEPAKSGYPVNDRSLSCKPAMQAKPGPCLPQISIMHRAGFLLSRISSVFTFIVK